MRDSILVYDESGNKCPLLLVPIEPEVICGIEVIDVGYSVFDGDGHINKVNDTFVNVIISGALAIGYKTHTEPNGRNIRELFKEAVTNYNEYGRDGFRICSHCGRVMFDGYYVEYGEYYCSEDCLHEHYSEEEYLQMYEEDYAYYTEWYG